VRLQRGHRIAQLVVQRVEHVSFIEVQSLPGSARGDGGYGSTGGFLEPQPLEAPAPQAAWAPPTAPPAPAPGSRAASTRILDSTEPAGPPPVEPVAEGATAEPVMAPPVPPERSEHIRERST
jgi:hypothetical protein